jgi:hypothetical protein
VGGLRKASAPVAVKVILRDVNDNAPVLAAVGDVALPAGSSRRTIATVSDTTRVINTKKCFIYFMLK